jgi:hypothetical protein
MREFHMKKIIASAVALAFAAPVLAADITITGDQEFSFQDNNGASSTALDGDFNVKATTETANGLTVSADINITEDGADDGSASLTIAGPFGSLDMGDTSSAVDAVDDTTDWGYVLTNGSPNRDAAVLWTLPSVVDGLSVYVSMSADTNYTTTDEGAGNGVALKYSVGDLSVRYGQNDNEDDTSENVAAITYSYGGLGVAAEQFTATTAAGVDTDTDTLAATYSMGDLTLAVETMEVSSAGAVSEDVMTMGVHYSLGGGVVAFIEQTDDDLDSTVETTAIGLTMIF